MVFTPQKPTTLIDDSVCTPISVKIRHQLSEYLTGTDNLQSQLAALESYAHWLEKELAQLLGRHSSLFWLTRDRVMPDPPTMRADSMHWALWRKLRLHTSLILKHASYEANDIRVVRANPWACDFAVKQAMLEEWWLEYSRIIPYLDALFELTENLYYGVALGGTLVPHPNSEWRVTFPASIERSKAFRFGRGIDNAFGIVSKGIASDIKQLVGHHPEAELALHRPNNPFIVYEPYALDYRRLHPLPRGRMGTDARFIRKTVFLDPLWNDIEPFNTLLEQQVGLPFCDLKVAHTAFHRVMANRLIAQERLGVETGLAILRTKDLVKALEAELGTLGVETITKQPELVINFMDFLDASSMALADHDVFSPYLHRCLFRYLDYSVIDLTATTNPIREAVNLLTISGRHSTLKGVEFEKYVINKVLAVPGVSMPIDPTTPLVRSGESTPYAEVDLYVQVNDLLFLIDCKAHGTNAGFQRDRHNAIRNRWSRLQTWLAEGDKRARMIAATPIGANYSIPRKVTHLIPVVCSSYPEVFLDVNEDLTLTPEIPRVCTVPELLRFLKDVDRELLLRKSYAVPLG